MRNFKIYYAILPSESISNCIAPGYRHISPNPLELQRAQESYIDRKNQENGFYKHLENSILDIGIRNPILIQAGFCVQASRKYLPLDAQEDETKILCCDRNGGSRLWIAQRYRMNIGCIISDFCDRFATSGFKELHTEEDVARCYRSKPKKIIINDHGVHVQDLPQIHLSGQVWPKSLEG